MLLGAGSQLAHDILRQFPASDVVARSHEQLDVTQGESVLKDVVETGPDVVINTAAFHQVDVCEDEPERAFAVNALGVRNVAEACAEVEAVLVHISTDYVFDGSRRVPWSETDAPNPINVYGTSKVAGETFVRNLCPKHILVRTSGLYGVKGASGKGGNFVETMLAFASEGRALKVVDDQTLSPTYTNDLAAALVELIGSDRYGVYHITNSKECSWFEFAEAIFELAGIAADLRPIETSEYSQRARRPPYSVLSNSALERAGLTKLRPWREALASYLKDRVEGEVNRSVS